MYKRQFQKCDTYAAGKIEPLEQVVDGLVREVKTRHIARLQAGVCTIEYLSLIHIDVYKRQSILSL